MLPDQNSEIPFKFYGIPCTFEIAQKMYGFVRKMYGIYNEQSCIIFPCNLAALPTKVSEVRLVVSVFNYYRKFIKNLALLCAPLYDLF